MSAAASRAGSGSLPAAFVGRERILAGSFRGIKHDRAGIEHVLVVLNLARAQGARRRAFTTPRS
eukprot:3047099-Alexandrium_andersonii.AAC.1